MIDESLLKSNFIGRDGFRWWIGQIPPVEFHEKQFDKEGWGNRCKVRIMGYHPPDSEELPNEDLPWAQILLSTTDGTGASNYATNHKIRPGDVVFGFFLDGDNAQIPVIMGCFGRTSEVSKEEYVSPFVPFTGYTEKIRNDGSKLKADQSNEQTTEAQKSPYYLPPTTANSTNQISYFSAIGDNVFLATNKPGSKLNKIETELQNAVKFLNDIKSYPNIATEWIDEQVEKLCEEISKKIEGLTNDIVNGVVNDTYEKIIPKLNEGSERLYDQVKTQVLGATQSASTAHLAGVRAQEATIEPVKQFQKLLPCLISNIMKSLASLIGDMVCALLKNVANVVKCIIDQFLGGLLNAIIDLITSVLSGVLGVLSILLSFSGFNLSDSIRQSAQGMAGIPFSLNCGEEQEEDKVKKWKIGVGPEQSSSFDVNQILSLANNASSTISGSASGVESAIGSFGFLNSNISVPGLSGSCYGGPPINNTPPIINIFGGGGSGATAIPIFGNGEIDSTEASIGAAVSASRFAAIIAQSAAIAAADAAAAAASASPEDAPAAIAEANAAAVIAQSTAQTAEIAASAVENPTPTSSIIGALVVSGGSGYTDPPFVSVTSNTNFGYGAVARSIIRNGEVIAIVMTSEGAGYTAGDNPDVTISNVIIENPGFNYQNTDKVVDNLGNEYDLVVDNGSIVKVTPINIKEIISRPVIRVISNTGSGAKLTPVFGLKEELQDIQAIKDIQGEVKQVIDCITK